MSSYLRIIKECYHKLGGTSDSSLLFDKQDLHEAAESLGMRIKNVADVRYSFDSRRELEIDSHKWSIITRSKGSYAMVPANECIFLTPKVIDCAYSAPDLTPESVKRYLGNDEQAALTKLDYSGQLKKILGFRELLKVQDHWRTTCSLGQLEIDSVLIGLNEEEVPLIVSVKRHPDLISKSYLYSLGKLAREKFSNLAKLVNIYVNDDCYLIWTADVPASPEDAKIAHCTLLKLY